MIVLQIGKVISITISGLGLLGFIAAIGLTTYEISIHTHNGLLEMIDDDRAFLLFSLCMTAFIFAVGALGFTKSQDFIKKLQLN